MTQVNKRPFGTWSSPISADLVASSFVSFSELAVDGQDLYFLESRPVERGRTALMIRRQDGAFEELTPDNLDARSMVHEYGGGAYAVHDGIAYVVNKVDQDIFALNSRTKEVTRMTDSGINERFADLSVSPSGRLLCVRETHFTDREPRNDLVSIDLRTHAISVIHEGHDFYASARISPNGKKITFLAWDHPNMPWDGTQLYLADVTTEGSLNNLTVIAGGTEESVLQPTWLDNDR